MSQYLQQFFAMGGYGAYVWSSVLFTVAILVWNIFIAKYQESHMKRVIQSCNEQENKE